MIKAARLINFLTGVVKIGGLLTGAAISFVLFNIHYDPIDDVRLDLIRYNLKSLAFALNQYHHVYGQYPQSLDDLEGEFYTQLPTYPDGSCYLYQKTENGFNLSCHEAQRFLEINESEQIYQK